MTRWAIALAIAVCAVVPFAAQTPSNPATACDAPGALKLPGVSGAQSTAAFARLFMVPGMGHCAGGNAPTRFDALAALEPWVEKGTAPEKMIAAQVVQGETKRTRPLCVYPQVAKWNGTGSPDEAANFTCKQP
jgi:hypothetical protein